MHELSVATHVVEIASDFARQAGARRVCRVTLRIGALTCVHRRALENCFPIACENTVVEGAVLTITDVSIAVYCPKCDDIQDLADIHPLCCPICGTLTGDVRRGNELDVESIEVID
ncbi:MAG: hydrogenase maturation nickel metallochaperone HypA [Rubripirellula sp.]